MTSRPPSSEYGHFSPKRIRYQSPIKSFNRTHSRSHLQQPSLPEVERSNTSHRVTLLPAPETKILEKQLKDAKRKAKTAMLNLNKLIKDLNLEKMKLQTENCNLQTEMKKLREENERCKEENERCKEENAWLRQHVCALHLQVTQTRGLEALLSDFWTHLLDCYPHISKKEIYSAVEHNGKCSHLSLQAGLQRFQFYISHAEALKAIRLMEGAETDSEHLQVSDLQFRQCLKRHQPYPLQEDVEGSIHCLVLRLVAKDVSKEDWEEEFVSESELDASRLGEKLTAVCEEMSAVKRRKLVRFILRDDVSIPGKETWTRISQSLPLWKPLKQLQYCKADILDKLESNEFLRKALSKYLTAIPTNEFHEVWSRYSQLSYDQAQFLEARSLEFLMKKHPAESVVKLSRYVEMMQLLHECQDQALQPEIPRAMPGVAED